MQSNVCEVIEKTGEAIIAANETVESGVKSVHRLTLVYNDLTSACSCQCVMNCSCDCDRKAL